MHFDVPSKCFLFRLNSTFNLMSPENTKLGITSWFFITILSIYQMKALNEWIKDTYSFFEHIFSL